MPPLLALAVLGCPTFEGEDCRNGREDDGDGLVDCEQVSCTRSGRCPEVCDNLWDDDADGARDEPPCPTCLVRLSGGRALVRAAHRPRDRGVHVAPWVLRFTPVLRPERRLHRGPGRLVLRHASLKALVLPGGMVSLLLVAVVLVVLLAGVVAAILLAVALLWSRPPDE